MRENKGFSLFEILVVISIIGIMMMVIGTSFTSAQKKGRDSRRIQDMQVLQKAAEQYYLVGGYSYPGANPPWTVSGTGQTILYSWPSDPKSVGWTAYQRTTNSASAYCYCAAVEDTNSGNSINDTCNFTTPGAKNYFCVKNTQ